MVLMIFGQDPGISFLISSDLADDNQVSREHKGRINVEMGFKSCKHRMFGEALFLKIPKHVQAPDYLNPKLVQGALGTWTLNAVDEYCTFCYSQLRCIVVKYNCR